MYNMKLKLVSFYLFILPLVLSHDHVDAHEPADGKTDAITDVLNPSHSMINHANIKATPHVMHHKHGVPILETELLPEELVYWQSYDATNYLNYPDSNRTSMYMYFSLIFMAFVVINPLLMVLNNVNDRSLTYLGGLVVNTVIILVGLLNYSVFMGSIPNLYPNNAFNVLNWIYLFTVPCQLVLALLKIVHLKNDYSQIDEFGDENDGENCPSITLYDLSRNQSPNSFDTRGGEGRYSNGFGGDPEADLTDLNLHLNRLKTNSFNSVFAKLSNTPVIHKFGSSCVVLFNVMNWFNFLFFFVYLPTGIATFGLLGMGNTVFNLLAHFIKGGVFFVLGLVSLARYCGAWSNKGFAWNYKFICGTQKLNKWQNWQPRGLITMEWVESFLIFFYGSTNVFLEHLANPGGKWSAKDLEHASIAFIFIGCGLCGLITESKLNNWRFNYSNPQTKLVIKSSPGFSPNPFPGLCIFWTGILMSQHQQASELSTKIHSQWGSLLAYGSLFRFATYVLNLLVPKPLDLMKPSKPITELIVSFALLAGGVIFMESCDPVVLALEYRGYDGMFTLNVCLGLVFLFMGWVMSVFEFRSWLA